MLREKELRDFSQPTVVSHRQSSLTPSMVLDQQISSLQVLEANATPWMPQALQVMVDGYFPYVPAHPPQQAEEVYEALYRLLCEDHYEALQRSFTFVVLFADLPQSDHLVVAGTLRLIVGGKSSSQRGPAVIPAQDLLDVSPAWPHRQEGQPDEAIGEWCRFAIAKPYRRHGVTRMLTSALAHAALQKSADLSLHSIYSIMPQKVYGIAHSPSIPFEEVAGASFLQTPYAHRFFDPLPGYWQQQSPRLYRLQVARGLQVRKGRGR